MESLLLSIISQYLKTYVNNFTREQVSLNFLRGQGVIRNLDINVDAINEAIFHTAAPALRFSRIMVNTLSVEAPIMNLTNKPIIFFIDRLFIEISEVVDIETKPPKKATKKAANSKYGFIDRVLDCLSFQVNRIIIAFQTLGRMKSTAVGPWTPPVVLLEFSGARVFCTNHNGFETELDECLRIRPTKRPLLFLYKKLEVEKFSMYLINPELWFTVADNLIKDMSPAKISGLNLDGGKRGYVSLKIFNNIPFEIMMCMRKRVDNNFLLGLEIAFTIEAIKINIRQKCLSELIHVALGISFCLFRLDSMEEMFGPDPYNEGFVSSSTSAGGATDFRTPVTSESRKIRRDQFGKAENESLDRLEAEMIAGAATVAADEDERGEEWHRSSLNSDEDPPHMRCVIVIQVNEATILFHLDPDPVPKELESIPIRKSSSEYLKKDISEACSSKPTASKTVAALPTVVILNFKGLVHSTISPEHAAATESVIQTTLKQVSVTEQVGVHKTCLLWTKEALDSDGRPVYITPLPRGVKEYSHNDLETVPETCFILKKNAKWPPPPMSKGIATSSEMCLCELGMNFKVETFDRLTALVMKSWDDRIATGDWGVGAAGGRVITVIQAGTSQSMIIISGLDISISPSVDLQTDKSSEEMGASAVKSCLMPSELHLTIGMITLVRKPSLDISCMQPLLDLNARETSDDNDDDVTDDMGDNEEDESRVSSTGSAHFPHYEGDLTNALKAVILADNQGRGGTSTPDKAAPSPGGGLSRDSLLLAASSSSSVAPTPYLKVRFEASMAEISLSISVDYSSTPSTGTLSHPARNSQPQRKRTEPRSRQLIKPFSLHYVTSLDLHPHLPPGLSPLIRPTSPYNREFYLTPSKSTISSSYLSVEGLVVESSLMDLMKAIHVMETTQQLVKTSRAYRLIFHSTAVPPVRITRDEDFDDSVFRSVSSSACESDVSQCVSQSACVFIFKASNVDVHIVPADDATAPAVLGLVTKFIHCVIETPSSHDDSSTEADGSKADPLKKQFSGMLVEESVEAVKEAASGSLDEWNEWIYEESVVVTQSVLGLVSSVGPGTAAPTPTDSPPQRITRLVKLVSGNLVLTTGDRPIFYLLGHNTAQDAVSHVSHRGVSGDKERRIQIAAGDGAPFLLLRCEVSKATRTHIDLRAELQPETCAVDRHKLCAQSLDNAAATQLPAASSISLSIRLPGTPKATNKRGPNSTKEHQVTGDSDSQEVKKRMGQIVLLPQMIPGSVRGVLKELLEGYGCVKLGAARWWEDTVYGFFKERLEGSPAPPVSSEASSSEIRSSSNGSTLVSFNIEAPSLSLVLLKLEDDEGEVTGSDIAEEVPESVRSCYAAICFELADMQIKGVTGGSDEVKASESTPTRNLSVALDTSLYLFQYKRKGDEVDCPALSSSLCASFPIRVNVSKTGSDPSSLTSCISMADFASTLSVPPTSKAMQLMNDFETYRQEALKILGGFQGSVRSVIPFLLDPPATHNSAASTSLQSESSASHTGVSNQVRIAALSTTPTTGNLLEQLRPETVDQSAEKGSVSSFITAYGAPSSSQQLITSHISCSLQSTHRNLEQLHLSYVLPSTMASSAIDEALLVCGELQEIALKLRHTALVTADMTPNYCGWVYRSHGFILNPPRITGRRKNINGKDSSISSGWGVRSWAVLVRGNLLFMTQPYARTVDLAVQLDDIVVSDPDESEVAAMATSTGPVEKVALSSSLWCVSGQGSLVLDCSSEKLLWLDALAPWLVGCDRSMRDIRNRANTTSSMSPRPTGGSRTDIPYEAGGNTRVQRLMNSSLGNAAAMIGAISISGLEDLGGSSVQGIAGVAANAKKLQNATTDLMRAFAVRSALPATFSNGRIAPGSNPAPRSRAKTLQSDSSGPPEVPMLGFPPRDHTGALTPTLTSPRLGDLSPRGGPTVPAPTQTKGSSQQPRNSSIPTLDDPYDRDPGGQSPRWGYEDQSTDPYSVIDLLDAVSIPLAHARSLLENSLALTAEQHTQAAACLRSSLKEVAQSLVGVSVLDAIAGEVSAADDYRSKQCILATDSARDHVRRIGEEVVHLNGLWRHADRRRCEQEALLQSCTMQHITTVVEMASQYDLLDEKYSILMNSAASPSESAKSILNFKELLKDLRASMAGTEQLLKNADEKETMMAEEILSVLSETASARQENISLKSELEVLRAQIAHTAVSHAAALAEERGARERAERARDILEGRVVSVLSILEPQGG